MKAKYRNIFFIIGIAAIVVMLFTFDVSLSELWNDLRTAGWWFFAILALWAFLYMLNTISWMLILRASGKVDIPFWQLYKITITGFALNSATPVGLMGSEPYKIMELTPHVGVQRATSSVILFTMTYIFAHFCFWFICIFLYIFTEPVDVATGILLTIVGLFCSLGLYFFIAGYRKGLAVKCINICKHIPFVKKWAIGFAERQRENLETIDRQIAELHSQNSKTFAVTLALEFIGRVLGCLEIYFGLLIFDNNVTFIQCMLILAFTSLFSNLMFIIPMQAGAREGGFAMSVSKLGFPARYGVFVGLICRVREIIFTVIGMALMKVGNRKVKNEK